MLDYKLLRNKFTKTLKQFDREKLDNWVRFDRQRMTLTKLLSGETVTIIPEVRGITKISDSRECIYMDVDSTIGEAA